MLMRLFGGFRQSPFAFLKVASTTSRPTPPLCRELRKALSTKTRSSTMERRQLFSLKRWTIVVGRVICRFAYQPFLTQQ